MAALAVYIPLEQDEKLKKAQVLKMFKENVVPEIEKKLGEKSGEISRAWKSFLSGLNREGHITKRQLDTWVNPF